ncbi:uncharacterized protein [Gossypium hirsutum]|uniref:DNA topoisomerase n=1 Tax=Gossypium hirsutum TaxID=3635 RepID=A0ABM2YXQ5_GOSHI|nr:uncharacterized protein LOC107902060 isoform X2 [Gossypium hirsutum]
MGDTENFSETEISEITQNHSQGIPQGDLNSSLIITNHRLDGKNFLQWSQSVLMVFRGRGKIGYINGQIPRPASTDSGYATWELNNSMVMAWLINSMEGHISRTYLFFKTAKEMWDAIKENYLDLGNTSQVFEIKLKLKDIRQGTLEVTQYYNNLKILWQELDMYYEVDWGEGLEHTKFMDHLNKERLYEFLAGLNRDLDEVRGQILGRTTLPTIGEAFAEVMREEKRRLIMLGDAKELKPLTVAGHHPSENSALISIGPQSQRFKDGIDSGSKRPWCSHCNRVGHTKEKCFKLHGYPEEKKQKENKAAMISTTEEDAQNVRVIKTQLEALHKLLGTPTASWSLAIQGTALNTTHEPITTSWILDSGAFDHMTGNLSLFHTYLPCHDHSQFRIADGSYSPVAGMGTVRLTENFSLDKVLHVPNFSCNLLLISKLTKDEKVLAEFSAFGCVVQEQESGKMIGTAEVNDGLYVWNKNSSKEGMALSTSKDDSIMLWHRRLGHPNFIYGPCQTPTLGFCVQRYLQINTFKPEKFWALHPYIIQNGYELQLEWKRQKLFDIDVAMMFQKLVTEDGILEVIVVSEKQETKGRPSGLNTVNLLKVASSALGYGPQTAMQLAERLYTQGFISYPRTESTAYPSSFDFEGTLKVLENNPSWRDCVQRLLAEGYHKPRTGTDAGDHPPITPMRPATEDVLGNDSWRLYQYICQHFMGTVSPDCKYVRTKIEFSIGGEFFHCIGQRVTVQGFTYIMPWLAINEKNLPQFTKGEKIEVSRVELYEGETSPPDYLSESELISLMEKNGIGTDASIPVHINNICERNYVQVQAGRRLVPTTLGITLIRGYQCIDPDLCLPDIRSFIEHQITLVAKGQANHSRVVQHVLQQFMQKFCYFLQQIENMDALFEAQFSPLADSGRNLSRCGKCLRYMKYISAQPQRMFCGTCEEVYYLPQKGTIKLYKELTCPLDNFELLIFSLPGPEGKSFPLCPYCYNSPPFEGIDTLFGSAKIGSTGKLGKGAGMPCFLCPHPTCRHSVVAQGVCACPECSGTLVLDPVSAPKWRLYCNKCNCLVLLPEGAHRIATTRDRCAECDSTIIEVDFNKKTTPLEDGATLHTGCILCDELLHSLVEVKHGKSFSRGFGARGRGRGRGTGRGRGGYRGTGRTAGKKVDPRMSFRDF